MNHKTRSESRKARKAQNAADRRTAIAYLAARPVRVTEEYCIGGADEPYHASLVEAARRLRDEGAAFGDGLRSRAVWFEGGVPMSRHNNPERGFGHDPLTSIELLRAALGWLRAGGGTINVTLDGCLPSYIRFSLGADKGDLRRIQQWVRACRLSGHPVRP